MPLPFEATREDKSSEGKQKNVFIENRVATPFGGHNKIPIFAVLNEALIMFEAPIKNFSRNKAFPKWELKAVFFDMDGVLYDSMHMHARAWTQAMQDAGLAFDAQDCYLNEGRTGNATINNAIVQQWGREATEEEKQSIYASKSAYFNAQGPVRPMPFALELLRLIRSEGKQIFVVTGSGQRDLIDGLNRDFPDIFHPDRMVTAFDVKHGKPHPEPYLMALGKSGLEPWQVLVVENAPLGVQSAAAAGLFCIGLNTGPLAPEVLSESGAQVVLDSMQSLYEHWHRLPADKS